MKALRIGSATLVLLALFAVSASAQNGPEISVEARGGIALPTFDIADAADPGIAFGGGVMVSLGLRVCVPGSDTSGAARG